MTKKNSMMIWARGAALAALGMSAGTAVAECTYKDFHEKVWHIRAKSFSKTQIVLTQMSYGFMHVDRVRSPRQYTSNDPLTPKDVRFNFKDRFSHDGKVKRTTEIDIDLKYIRPEESFSGRHKGQYHIDKIDDVIVELRAGPHTKRLESKGRFVSVDDFYDHARELEITWYLNADQRQQVLKHTDVISVLVYLKSDPSIRFDHTFQLPSRASAEAKLARVVKRQGEASLDGDC